MSKQTNLEECDLAAIRIRGLTGVRKDIETSLERLRLRKKNCCVLLKSTPDNIGQLRKCKDFISWGNISPETRKELIERRGKKDRTGHDENCFSLHPPRGGFGRKGIKKPFSSGGALGNRKEKMNDLIMKMI